MAVTANEWPLSQAMRAKCVVDPATGKIIPPSFERGKGPIGSATLHTRNSQGVEFFRIARGVMEAFVEDLVSRVFGTFNASKGASWRERAIWFCPQEFFHTIVTVFVGRKLINEERKQKS